MSYKIDLQDPTRQRFDRRDRTETPDPALALAAFRKLLQRADLAGQSVAARLVVDGRSLYYSKFDKPLGRGRIHPDAPLRLDVSRDQADELAKWLPGEAARPGSAGGEVAGRAAAGEARATGGLDPAAVGQLQTWLTLLAHQAPDAFARVTAVAQGEVVAALRGGSPALATLQAAAAVLSDAQDGAKAKG